MKYLSKFMIKSIRFNKLNIYSFRYYSQKNLLDEFLNNPLPKNKTTIFNSNNTSPAMEDNIDISKSKNELTEESFSDEFSSTFDKKRLWLYLIVIGGVIGIGFYIFLKVIKSKNEYIKKLEGIGLDNDSKTKKINWSLKTSNGRNITDNELLNRYYFIIFTGNKQFDRISIKINNFYKILNQKSENKYFEIKILLLCNRNSNTSQFIDSNKVFVSIIEDQKQDSVISLLNELNSDIHEIENSSKIYLISDSGNLIKEINTNYGINIFTNDVIDLIMENENDKLAAKNILDNKKK